MNNSHKPTWNVAELEITEASSRQISFEFYDDIVNDATLGNVTQDTMIQKQRLENQWSQLERVFCFRFSALPNFLYLKWQVVNLQIYQSSYRVFCAPKTA